MAKAENPHCLAKMDALPSLVPFIGVSFRSSCHFELWPALPLLFTLRISRIHDPRDGTIQGITLRVGRHVAGVSAIFGDILADLAHGRRKGLLLVGAPGLGKTTLLRCGRCVSACLVLHSVETKIMRDL